MYSSTERQEAESRDYLPSMMEVQDLPSHNSQSTSYSSFLSDPGSRTGDSFNGFDHQEAHRINNASTTDMLNLELEFDSVQKRLETFKTWPVDSPIKPHELATAGFRSSGLDDRVVCFRCDLHLRQWKTGEDPWNEHKKRRPRCPFVLECESENGSEVHDSPAGTTNFSKAQDPGEISLVQSYPRYGHPNYPAENVGHTHVEMVSGTRIRTPSNHDPSGVPYSERPQYVTQGGEYGYHEQPYVNRYPADVQTGYHDQQVYYPGRTQEFHGRDPRMSQYQRPEHQRMGTEITRHVVVNSGTSQVHIVGSGAAFFQLHPQDKLVIQSGSQGHPQQVRPVRDLTSMYPEANQTSRFPSKLETSLTGPSEGSRYSSEETMSNRYQSSPSTVSYAPSYAEQFAKQPGYENPVEESLSQGTVEFRRSVSQNTGLPQGGGRSAKYMQYQGRSHSEEQVTYMNTVHETSAPNQPPFPQKAPETFYEPYTAEKKVSNEDGLVQEICYRPQQRYPGTKSETRETNPYPPPLETSRWQDPGRNDPPGSNVQGTRRPTPFAAFPVRHPSLQPAQRPLIRHEDARHVTSSADLASEHHRLTTFVDWPHDHPLRPVDLAAAGFYYLGTGDSVKCYRCGIPLHNWDPTDTPWGEHQKWKPQCPLVLEHLSGRLSEQEEHAPRQRATSQERFTTPQEAFQYRRPQQTHGLNDRQVPIRSGDPPVHGTWGRSQSFPVATVSNVVRPQTLPLDQQQPHWQTQPVTTSQAGHMTSALQSGSSGVESGSSQDRRSCSPRGSTALEFDTEKLAEMGFTQQQINDAISDQIETTGSTFSSYADLVSALLERQTRLPTNETYPQPTHQRCEPASPPPSPISPFPTNISSSPPQRNQDLGERNCVSAVTSPTTPVPDVSSLRRSLSAPMSRSSESGEESLEEKLERMQEERMCKICMDDEVSVVFLPCGHLSCCANCANGMDFCPMCRAPIQEKIRTFLS